MRDPGASVLSIGILARRGSLQVVVAEDESKLERNRRRDRERAREYRAEKGEGELRRAASSMSLIRRARVHTYIIFELRRRGRRTDNLCCV